ncbi:MAG: TIGR03943 family protein [Firmicutes bacterium]|nr:TIGR03943 family protein [Bacillota bacterium]
MQSTILAAYGALLLFLNGTGLLQRYVDPGAGQVYVFAAIFLFLLAAGSTGRNKRTATGNGLSLMLLLPVLLVLVFPAKDFGSSLVDNKGIRLLGSAEGREGLPTRDQYTAKMNNHFQEITLDKENFLLVAEEMERHPAAYVGKKIALEGFVCYPAGLKKGEMVTARYIFSHCAADIQALGLLVELDGLEPPPPDTWVRVEGLLSWRDNALVVRNVVLDIRPKPEKSYLYPGRQ